MEQSRVELFEQRPVPSAVLTLAVPTILSSLVMVLYNLADTYFVGMLNDPVESAGVALAAPVLLAFNAINNLFGVGSSSMMSRALGLKDEDTVARSSAFGFYCALVCALLFSLAFTVFQAPLLRLLGADATTAKATGDYLFWTVTCGAPPAILNVVLAYLVRAEGATLHASIGTMSGCLLNIVLDPIYIMPWGFGMGAAGAGLATFLSNCAACGYFFVLSLSTSLGFGSFLARIITLYTYSTIHSCEKPSEAWYLRTAMQERRTASSFQLLRTKISDTVFWMNVRKALLKMPGMRNFHFNRVPINIIRS